MLRIGRRDLQAVEEKAGTLGIELIRSERLQDFGLVM